nr:formate dehydrogenase accessory sulfurtransferase FdhD [Rhodococcus sp. ZPP]
MSTGTGSTPTTSSTSTSPRLASGIFLPDNGIKRNFYTPSSCGVCGTAFLDAIRQRTKHSPATDPVRIDSATPAMLSDTLRAAQKVFDTTGGLHAADVHCHRGPADGQGGRRPAQRG